jgi:hypothetical protein
MRGAAFAFAFARRQVRFRVLSTRKANANRSGSAAGRARVLASPPSRLVLLDIATKRVEVHAERC